MEVVGECRTCASLCRSAVLAMSCFLLSEGQSHETSVLCRTARQNGASSGTSPACTVPAGTAGISPTSGNARFSQVLGRVMQAHPRGSTWIRCRSGWASSAWPGPAPVGLDLSWFVQSRLCSCTAWPNRPVKRNAVKL